MKVEYLRIPYLGVFHSSEIQSQLMIMSLPRSSSILGTGEASFSSEYGRGCSTIRPFARTTSTLTRRRPLRGRRVFGLEVVCWFLFMERRSYLDTNTNKRGNCGKPHESQTQLRSRKGCVLLKRVFKIVVQHVFTSTRKITACLPAIHPSIQPRAAPMLCLKIIVCMALRP